VILSARSALLPAGRTHEPQAIVIDSNAGRQWIGVSADIASGPSLGVEQLVLDYGTFQGDEERSLPVIAVNQGRQTLAGSVASRVPWLRVPQPSFRCPPGQSARVAVVLLPDRLPQGPQETKGALVVDSDGGQEQIEVRAWRKRAVLDLGTAHMDFGVISSDEAAERYLYIGNTGDGLLEGTARSLVPWLQASPQHFTCAPGEMTQIAVTADSVGLPDGTLDLPQALRVQTNGGTATLSLHMQVRAPRMLLGTVELSFGAARLGEVRERPLIIRNTGSATLSVALQSLVDWLSLPQAQLVCEPGEEASVTVRADTSHFSRGQEIVKQPALRLIAGSTITELPASITVLQPALRVEPAEVDFGYIDRAQPETATVLIANDGTGELAWNAQADTQWLELTPHSGVCGAGQSSLLTLTAYGLALESGVEAAQGTLIITSDGGRAKVPLRIGLAAPRLEVDTSLLDLGTSVNSADISGSFRIFNRGLGLLRGSIRASQTWLVVDRASFECSTGRSIEVRIATDMAEYPADTPSGSGLVSIESNGGSSVVEVRVRAILAPYITVAGEAVLLSSTGPDEPLQGRLVIRNTGQAVAHTHLAPSTTQLVLSRELCDIKPDKSVRIAVRWDGDRPDSDQGVYVDITSGDQQLRVPVRFADLPPSARTAAHITDALPDGSTQATMRIGKEV